MSDNKLRPITKRRSTSIEPSAIPRPVRTPTKYTLDRDSSAIDRSAIPRPTGTPAKYRQQAYTGSRLAREDALEIVYQRNKNFADQEVNGDGAGDSGDAGFDSDGAHRDDGGRGDVLDRLALK